jgi:hypothetical protein
MSQEVLVYNPATTPAIYGEGRTLGGQEWMSVSVQHLDELLAAGCIHIPDEAEPPTDTDPTADDSFLVDDEVSSVPDEPVEVESEPEAPEQEPATSSTPRRTRKSSSEKE